MDKKPTNRKKRTTTRGGRRAAQHKPEVKKNGPEPTEPPEEAGQTMDFTPLFDPDPDKDPQLNEQEYERRTDLEDRTAAAGDGAPPQTDGVGYAKGAARAGAPNRSEAFIAALKALQDAKAVRTTRQRRITGLYGDLDADGFPREVVELVEKYLSWPPKRQKLFDHALITARQLAQVPLQLELFDEEQLAQPTGDAGLDGNTRRTEH